MTIKRKIYTAGAAVFFIFFVLAFMNIRTHHEVLTNLRIRDEVNEELIGIEEFLKWKNQLIRTVYDIAASGMVPTSAEEYFNQPVAVNLDEKELLATAGQKLVDLIGEKERISREAEENFNGFRMDINDLYYRLDEEIATVLARAQMGQVLGLDSTEENFLAPYVLKSLNQLTLIAQNSLISRNFTEESLGVVEKNKQFLSSQLYIIDQEKIISALFNELFGQIESLHTFILKAGAEQTGIEALIAEAEAVFNKIVEITETDAVVQTARDRDCL